MNLRFLINVCYNYNLGKLKKYFRLRAGVINEKYKISTTEGIYILRFCERGAKQLQFELKLLTRLKNLPVPKLITNRKGKAIGFFNKKPYFVYHYIFGKVPKKITKQIISDIAEFQATLHKLGKNFSSNITREPFTYAFSIKKINAFEKILSKKLPKKYLLDSFFIKNLLLSHTLESNLPSGPVHADLKPENILCNNNKLSGVLDFDNSYMGQYMVDIGKTIMWFCVINDKLSEHRINYFIRAYQKIRRFNYKERELLNNAIIYAIASQIYLDYYKYVMKMLPKKYLDGLIKKFLPILKRLPIN